MNLMPILGAGIAIGALAVAAAWWIDGLARDLAELHRAVNRVDL